MTAPPWPHNGNIASDHAYVGQQVGVHAGDTTFHNYEIIYNYSKDDPPQRRYDVAGNHLKGGSPRFAEEIFGELLREGHASTRLAYYYALSVLSGRSLNEIDGTVYHAFTDACAASVRFPADGWLRALGLVQQLMSSVWRQERGGPADAGSLQEVLDHFTSLPPRRQTEITRHLDLILGGAIQDRLDDVDARRVETERMERNRAERAWKFFEPDPALPRLFMPFAGSTEPATWLKLLAGAVILVPGLVFAVTTPTEFAVALFGVLIAGCGGYLVVSQGTERRFLAKLLARRDLEHGIPFQRANPNSPGHWVRTDFVSQVHSRVDAGFSECRPHVAGSWEADTRGIREYLKGRLVTLYGNAQVAPPALDWLIRWHARRVGVWWRAGRLLDYRAALVVPGTTNVLFGLGVAGTAIGVVGIAASGAVFGAVVIGFGVCLAMPRAVDVLATRRNDGVLAADNERLFHEENQGRQEWLAVLADRPSDSEMGEWLNLDTSFLRTQALRRCGLTNRDLVGHVVLTEGGANARRARVRHGAFRHSAYVVLVFLLTRSGVREVEVDLDFLTGNVHDERRTSFRYDTLSSARVAEVGVRYANDRRYIVGADDVDPHLGGGQVVRSRAFTLSLLDGKDLSVVVENFDGLTDVTEDQSRLLRMALDTSGIAGALHILEAVAAEGRDWITREQERRARLSEEWREGERAPRLIGTGPFSTESEG